MSPFSVFVLAISMSADAFAASAGRGATLDRPRLSEALRTGAVFGIIEAITPVIGWAAGIAASGLVQAIDHWIAFVLLGVVGLHMIYGALRATRKSKEGGRSRAVLVATAIGTSIDAMAVGVSLAFLRVNIIVIAIAVGCATFVLSSGGTLVGRFVGERFGRIAEAAAGLGLFLIGLRILIEHLSS